MNISALSATQWALIIAIVLVAAGGIATLLMLRKRHAARLRAQFGGPEYARAVREGGTRRRAEAKLDDALNAWRVFISARLPPGDHARFIKSWRRIQSRFVDSPGGAVTEADQLLGDVMSLRGYPVSEFEQRAAEISVDHPLVMENYRAGHGIAVRQTLGQASTEELRQSMIHYRTLFEELVGEPELAHAKAAS